HARNRLRVVRLAAELVDARSAGLDVVDVEVDADRTRITREEASPGVLGKPGHVVLLRPLHRLELPTEQAVVEPLRAARVFSGDLDVHWLAGHQLLLSRRGRVARYAVFAFSKNRGSRWRSATSHSTKASLYWGEPNFGTCTNSGRVSSEIACTRRTL